MKYNGSGTGGGDAGEHIIQILENTFTVVVPEKKTTITVTKSGTANVAGGVVEWAVKVDPVLDDGAAGLLESCTFTDNLTDVGDYVADSFKLGTKEDGLDAAVPTTREKYDSATKILTYDFLAGDSGARYIFFKTAIPQDKLDGTDTSTIDNVADVTTKRADVTIIPGSVKVKLGMTWIEKSGKAIANTGIYDPKNQRIEWSIIANHNAVTLTNAVITDALPSGLTWESAKLQTWDSATDGWKPSGVTFPNAPAAGEYKLGTISTKILLTITTKVKDINPPTGITGYKNTARIKWDGLTGAGYDATSDDVGVGFAPIKKEEKDYNQSTHEIDWSVSVDAQSQNYGGDLRIMDLLVYGDKFDKETAYTIGNNDQTDLFKVDGAEIKDLTPGFNQKYVVKSFDGTASGLGVVVHTLTKNGEAVADLLVVAATDGTGISNATKSSFTYKSVVTNPRDLCFQ